MVEVRAIAQVDKIFPSEPQANLIDEDGVGDRYPVLDQFAIAAAPGQLLGYEDGRKRIRPQISELCPGDILDYLMEAHRACLGTAERGEEGLLINGKGVSGLCNRSPVSRVLNRIREH